MPSYESNAPQGYMGDWKRGAPMGRPSIAPDTRTPAALQSEAAECLLDAQRAERDRENRNTPDPYKRDAWDYAAAYFRRRADELLAMIPAADELARAAPKVTLQRVRLDSGGYDTAGAYWGQGEPLYWAATDEPVTPGGEPLDMTFRADDRDDAKAQVRQVIPGARFFR